MTKNSELASLAAAFLAKGGNVTHVETGAKAFPEMTNSAWYRASQSSQKIGSTPLSESDEIISERRHELAHDFFFVGDKEAGYAAMRGEFDRE